MTDKRDEALKLALEFIEQVDYPPYDDKPVITAIRSALAEQPARQKPACKQNLQVWVISNGKGRGQFSWEPQDERYWTRMEPAIKQDLTPEQPAQQEPVAWLHTKIEGVAVPHRPNDLDKHPDRWTALYPEPKPCPTCEALARTVMMDQTAHDKQRKSLTDEQIMEMYNEPRSDAEMIAFARAIEAAHGIGEQK